MKALLLGTIVTGIVLAQTPATQAPKPAATKPPATTPAKPAATTPAKPAATTPAKPAATTPAAAAPKPVAPKPVAPKVVVPPEPARDPGLYAYFDIVEGTGAAAKPLGRIIVKFYDTEMPITVRNFVDLARGVKPWTDPNTRRRVTKPLYNGLIFHRVIPGFMIQGGDPMGNGFGGTDAIVDEFHPSVTNFDKPYLLAMANAGPGTGSSQFFLTTKPGPNGLPVWLNGRHPIFGVVVEGSEVVDKIAELPRNEADNRPNTPVVMKSVTIRRFPAGQPIFPVAPAAAKPKPAGMPAPPPPKK